MISQNSIAQVIEVAHIEDVINDFVSLKKRGVNMLGLCPFHNEKTPSFTVSPTKNLYKCFGCGKGGNAVTFIMEHENYSFPETIRYLAQKYGIEIEETVQTEKDKEDIQQKESLFIINEYAKRFFHESLLNSDEGKSVGLSYFTNRGILPKTIIEFHLGYSPSDSKTLVKKAEKDGYKSEYLETLGLKSKNGYDFFRSRVIFPITNLSGKVIGFGGRTLSSDKKVPKYLNSPESEIYKKSKSLYGIFQAKNQIRREDNCYLVEGYTDVLSLFQNDVKNVVASSGTSLTSGQLRVIKRFCSNITFLYDGDSAGQKAALRGLPLALDEDLNVKIVPLDEKQDPDSLVQEMGATAFQEYISDKKEDFIIYHAKWIADHYKSLPIEKSTAIKALIETLAHLKDTIKRSFYIKEIGIILSLDEGSIIAELNKNIRKQISKKKRETYDRKPQNDEDDFVLKKPLSPTQNLKIDEKDFYQEKDIIRILIHDGKKRMTEHDCTVAEFIIENIKEIIDSFGDETFKKILKEYQNNITKGEEGFDINHYINHSDTKIQQVYLNLAESPYSYANWSENGVELQTQKNIDENHERDSEQALLRYLLRKMSMQVNELQEKIKDTSIDDHKKVILIKTYHKILEHRKGIADSLGTIVL
ncbi:MAG: DNA primase [Saprospiraceae bacterium]